MKRTLSPRAARRPSLAALRSAALALGLGLSLHCAVDSRDVAVGAGAGAGGSGEPVAITCGGRLTASCGEIFGATGECRNIVLACSSDGFWPSSQSCTPPELAGRCELLPPIGDPNSPDGGCSGPGCQTESTDGVDAGDGGVIQNPEEPTPLLCPAQSLDIDELFELILADVVPIDIDDQPFTRYLSLSNRYNAGVCSADLERDRLALAEVVNLLSLGDRIALPVAIDPARTLYRIDLRDYGWDRGLVLGGISFVDAWEAIAAQSPYAVAFVGPDADDVALDTGTTVPWMYADALIDAAAQGQLYYALIGIGARPLDDFLRDGLGIVDPTFNAAELLAGLERSAITRQSRMVARRPTLEGGYLWESRGPADAAESILPGPFVGALGEEQLIFSLPNGLAGYAVAATDRTLSDSSDLIIDDAANSLRAQPPVSCLRCHAEGVLSVVDQVRPYVEANPTDYDAETFDFVTQKFVTRQVFDANANADNQARRTRLDLLSIPAGSADPVQSVFDRFDLDLRLADVAGDLGVVPEDLLNNLNALHPTLSALDNSTLDRDDFATVFRETLCTLGVVNANQPAASICE